MIFRYRCVVVAAVLLGACSFEGAWRDVSGQNRGEASAKADYDICHPAAQFPESRDAPHAEYEAAAQRLIACMAGKGWQLVRR